jgi:hypothetical protein
MKNNLIQFFLGVSGIGVEREKSGASGGRCRRAIDDVEFVSRDWIDCVAPRALEFSEKRCYVTQIEGGAATRAIDRECWISSVLGLLRN